MIMRNIRIWRRCQNGGEPARSVNKMTPQAQLGKRPKSGRTRYWANDTTQRKAGETRNSQIDLLAVAWVGFIHGAFKDLWC